MNPKFLNSFFITLFCSLAIAGNAMANKGAAKTTSPSSMQSNTTNSSNLEDIALNLKIYIAETEETLRSEISELPGYKLINEVNRWIHKTLNKRPYLPGLHPEVNINSALALIYSHTHPPREGQSHLSAVVGNVDVPVARQMAYRFAKVGNFEKATNALHLWEKNLRPASLLKELRTRLELNKNSFRSFCAKAIAH